MGLTEAEVRQHLEAVLDECFKVFKGQFREICLGFEAGLGVLADKGVAVGRLQLDFFQDGIKLGAIEVLEAKPDDYQLEGSWAVIYACLTPRSTPFGGDPLRVKALEVGYGMAPRITYDADHDNGLPMAFNRPYDATKVKGALKR